MQLADIKKAVDAGETVHWANTGYTVVRGDLGGYYITHHNGHCVGLTWEDGSTLNGEEGDFFVAGKEANN